MTRISTAAASPMEELVMEAVRGSGAFYCMWGRKPGEEEWGDGRGWLAVIRHGIEGAPFERLSLGLWCSSPFSVRAFEPGLRWLWEAWGVAFSMVVTPCLPGVVLSLCRKDHDG